MYRGAWCSLFSSFFVLPVKNGVFVCFWGILYLPAGGGTYVLSQRRYDRVVVFIVPVIGFDDKNALLRRYGVSHLAFSKYYSIVFLVSYPSCLRSEMIRLYDCLGWKPPKRCDVQPFGGWGWGGAGVVLSRGTRPK